MKIGIPKALYYHKYGYLWKKFLEYLDIPYIVSKNTNKNILEDGKKNSTDETCIPCKIYLGHIAHLKDKCTHVLVPRFLGIEKQRIECIKFNSIYDVVKNTFEDVELLEYDIDYTKKKYEKLEFVKLGNKLNKKTKDSVIAYLCAKRDYDNYRLEQFMKQEKLVNNSKNKKILILSHSYNINDEVIGKPVINILKKYNIALIYSNRYLEKKDNSKKYSETLYWNSNKEIINALDYYKDKVDGIIILTAFPCGNDCLVNELMMRKIKDKPMINVVVDELNSETGLITRLESFIDIIEEKGGVYEESH